MAWTYEWIKTIFSSQFVFILNIAIKFPKQDWKGVFNIVAITSTQVYCFIISQINLLTD